MEEPTEYDGAWWRRGDDGGWLRWDPIASAWMPSREGPEGATSPRPVPLEPFAPLGDHMRLAVGFLAAAVIFDVVAVLAGLQEYLLFGRMAEGLTTAAEVRANEARQALVDLLQAGLFIAAGIAFLRWFRRAYANLPGLQSPRSHGTGWAIGAWFVPLLNLVRPKRMADELWRAGALEDEPARIPPYVHLWWAGWLLTIFVGYLVLFGFAGADDAEAPRAAAAADSAAAAGWIVVADLLSVLAGILAIRLVRDVTERQHAKRAVLEEQHQVSGG